MWSFQMNAPKALQLLCSCPAPSVQLDADDKIASSFRDDCGFPEKWLRRSGPSLRRRPGTKQLQGSGPLVMFMHGFPDNAWSYRMQMQVFADAGYRAVSPFLRGYAPTEIPADGIFDPIALGKDLEALIAALSDDGQARVVGMDWGGTSTFQALATAPSAIKAAVVMNTTHPITIESIRSDPDSVRSVFHVYFFTVPGAHSAVNIEGLPFVDYLWKLWSPTFENDEHLRSVKETLSSPGT